MPNSVSPNGIAGSPTHQTLRRGMVMATLLLAVVAGALLLAPPPAKAQLANLLYVSFHLPEYEVMEGGTVTVWVTLDAPSDRSVTIPITATNQGGATSADYSGVPASVTFATGEDAQSFIFTATTDSVADLGESVLLGFGTLPSQVSDGDSPQSTVRIISPLLVSNIGQTISVGSSFGLDTTSRIRAAQGFTTGTEDDGYTLASLGIDFRNIHAATAGANLQVTLNAESGDDPGNALCTLSHPGFFPVDGTVTFGFPSTCPGLAKQTSYYVVLEHLNAVVSDDPDNPAVYWVQSTAATAEDAGSTTEWSIADVGRASSTSTGHWQEWSGLAFLIKLRGVVGSTTSTVGTNSNPTFDAGETATRTLPENSGAGVDVIGGTITATDGDSDTLTYSLTGTDAGSFEIDSSGQIKTKAGVAHNFNFEATKNSYSVTVSVSDSKNSTGVADTAIDDTIAVTIDLTNVDEAGTVTLPALFMRSTAATASVADPDGAVSGPSWQWARGDTATGSFSDISGATSASYTPVAADVGKYLRATVTYKDPESTTIDKTANATSSSAVGAINSNPTFSLMTATRTLPENSGAGVNVVGGTITATDGNSDTLTYSLTGTDAGSFEIDSNGQIKTKTGVTHSFNFEAAKNSYSVTVNVSDSKDDDGNADSVVDDTIAVTIDLTNVNDAPTFTSPPATADFAENGTGAIVDFDATDEDGDAIYFIPSFGGNDDSGLFTMTPTGELRFFNPPNFERPRDRGSDNNYVVTVLIEDDGSPTMGASHEITVTVTNVNDAPVITTAATTASVAENSSAVLTLAASDLDASDTQTWSVETADDGSFFEITQDGVLSFTNAPDFENKQDADTDNVYEVTVKVTDAGGLPDTHTVTVTVTNVNEAPEITTTSTTHTAFDVDENTATSDVIKTYVATDVDASTTLTWSLEGNDAGDFTITKNADGDGELKFRNAPNFEVPADADTMNDYDIRVKVKDNGIPGNRGSSNRLDDTVSVEVDVLDVNEAPVVSGHVMPEFAEIEYDATSPDLTVSTWMYTDEDQPADTITWGIRSSFQDAVHFNISASGVLSFNMPPDFENPADRGSDNDYEIIVEADDGQGGVGSEVVVVVVINVDETPEITTTAASHIAPFFPEIEYDFTGTPSLEVETYAARDEESQTISWSLGGDDAGDFTINSSGALSFRNPPNYEMPAGTPATPGGSPDNTYEIVVRARDTASPANVRELEVTVTVTDENETPDVTGPADNPNFPETPYDSLTTPNVATFTARDEEMQIITWSLIGDDAGQFTITKDATGMGVVTFGNPPNFETPADADSLNTYEFTVQAYDGTNTGTWDYAVTVTDVNETPEFTGTPETAITLDEHDANTDYVVTDLADYDARDEEGGVTWSLAGTDRGDFAISADGVVTFAETPNYEAPRDSGGNNVYEFMVVATDVASGSSRRNVSQAVTVTVGDVEETGTLTVDSLNPVAGQTLTFVLTDPDGGIDTSNITWDIQSMATGGSWTTVSGVVDPVSTTFPWTVDEDETGKKLRALVTYTDRRGSGKTAQSEETAEVTANPIANAPPRFRGGSTWSVEEGPAGTPVGTPTSATDRDNDTLTYGIQSGQDSAFFEIDPSTGQVRTAQALDFETASNLLLSFTLTLHDGRDAADNVEATPVVDVTRSVIVTILDVEEDGVVTLSAVEPETGTPLTATLEDGDGGVTGPEWQWARSEDGRTGWTIISGATSSSYTPTETDGDFYLRARVEYTDRRGASKSAERITDNPVPSVNRRPRFPSTETGERAVPENTRAGVTIGAPVAAVDPENDSLTYTLTGTDAAAFTIVEMTGQIRVKDDLDYETQLTYSVTVEVHDGQDGSGNPSTTIDDTQEAVTITVENVEEQGMVTLTTDTGQIQARVEVTAVLEDDDVPSGVTWQWSRSPNGRTDWVNIQSATFATYTPTLEVDKGNYIRATASYTDGYGPNKTAEKVSQRVGDPPPVNSAPAFPSTENGQREAPEDTLPGAPIGDPGAPIGDPVAATDLNAGDPDVNDPLAYSLTGTDAASFTIDAGTGQIRLAPGIELDYEGKRTYRFTVQVTDGRDQNGDDDMDAIDDTLTVTVSVTNVNEVPVVTGDVAPSYQEDANQAIATYTGTDPERDPLTWTVSNTTDFWVSQRGQLYFRTPPSFEARTSYTVTVTATDDDANTALSGSLSVTVAVTDAEEEGAVTIEPPRGWDGTVYQAVLDDDDGGITGETWQWQRSSNRSSWTDIANATSDSYTAEADDINTYLRVTVEYTDRRGSNKETSATVTGRIEDSTDRPTSNNAPEFTEDDDDTDSIRTTARSVGQGTAAGRSVGAPVRANDEDASDVLTYSLFGTDAALFDINPATGQLLTKAVLDHDPDGMNTYTVDVRVHDGYGPDYQSTDVGVDATITVTITVTAVAQRTTTGGGGGGGFGPAPTAPKFVDGFRTERPLAVTARPGDAVGDPVAATHPEDLEITYALSGANASLFTVDAETGQIRLGEGVTLEVGQTYTVNLTSTDSTGTGAIIIVVIAVAEGVGDPYDLNRNGIIEKDEVLRAIADYFAGLIEKDAVLALVARYFAG